MASLLNSDSSDSEVELKPKTQRNNSKPCSSTMSEKLSILDHDSSDSEVEIKINKNYADRYSYWRGKEELQKYKDLKKRDEDSDTSSESDEEVPEFDEEFFRALSLLKGKDPRLFDKSYKLFTEKEVKKTKAVKEKPMFMKDYERSLVVDRGGKFSDEDEEMPTKKFTYDEELENLKKPFKEILQDSDDEDNDLLNVRTKTKTEEEDEEADYLKWLKGEEKEVSEDIKKDMSHLREYWNDPKLDKGEKFLRDYILNKRYLEKDDSEIPSYEEITSGRLSDDEKMIEEQENFERKYNFRFEEPDEEFIKRYPRTIGDSLRKTDNRRKQKRDEKVERRRVEREQRKEELKRLKAFKRKEIEEKFSKLKEIAGQNELNLNESDLESDFDPDKHEQKMRLMFNDDYYGVEEDQKPEFPYDEELDSENWNAWSGEKIVSEGDEDEKDDEQEIEENDNLQEHTTNPKEDFMQEMIEASQPRKKIKRKSLFAKVISQPKPIYDPDGKSFDDYLDEYYKLEYEDVIGDMPVRYKYRKVIPNNFGLTVEEILAADDKELNRWCSVKKTCQYRNDDEEIYDVQAYKKKSQNPVAKKKVLSSLFVPKDADSNINDDRDKLITKSIINKNSNSVGHGSLEVEENVHNLEYGVDHQNSGLPTKRPKKKSKKSLDALHINTVSETPHDFSDSNQVNNDIEENTVAPLSKKRKKKKKKTASNISQLINQLNVEPMNISIDREADFSDCLTDNPSKSKKRKHENFANEALGSEDDVSGDHVVKKKNKLKHNLNLSGSGSSDNNTVAAENSSQKKKHVNLPDLVSSDSNTLATENSSQKPKKKKHVNLSGSACTDTNTVAAENSSEKPKKKKHVNLSGSVSSVNNTVASENSSQKPKKKHMKLSGSVSSDNKTVAFENSSQKPKKKKKKRAPVMHHSQNIVSHSQKLKNKSQTQVSSDDKRLGLSDERLAAYGINPKKFKNKILYSKK